MDQMLQKKHSEKTIKGVIYAIVGVTLPFTLSILGILTLKEYSQLWLFIDHGQFLIFSAGLLTSAIYIYRDEENQSVLIKSDNRLVRSITDISIAVLIFTSALYAILYTINISKYEVEVSYLFIRFSSFVFFSFSIYAIYWGTHTDFKKILTKIDVKEESNKEINDIMDKL